MQISPERVAQIQALADAEGLSFEKALDRVFWAGLLVMFSEIISARIPEPLRGFIVSDYQTVKKWLATLPPSNYPDPIPEHFKFMRQMSDWFSE